MACTYARVVHQRVEHVVPWVVLKNPTNWAGPAIDALHRTIIVGRPQRWSAASAALNVLLGRITAVVISLSGA